MYSVKIIQKPKTDKRKATLTLDVYPPIFDEKKGKKIRKRISLKKWVYVNPKGTDQKQHNKNELAFADKVRYKYENELNKEEIYSELEKRELEKVEKGRRSFNEYFKSLERGRSHGDYQKWVAAYNHFKNFAGENVLFNQINKPFCERYKSYLLTTKNTRNNEQLNQNSAASYFNKFKYTLKKAFEEELIDKDYGRQVKAIDQIIDEREHLTEEEVMKLINTECDYPVLKRAALFSIFSGMRHIHIRKMKWEDVTIDKENKDYSIHYFEEKGKNSNTRGRTEEHEIGERCLEYLGEPSDPKDLVFTGLSGINKYREIPKWIEKAGIDRHITFHAFRHTYATLLLQKGANPYVVSKLMGHKDLSTTEIYVHQIKEEKKRTANLL